MAILDSSALNVVLKNPKTEDHTHTHARTHTNILSIIIMQFICARVNEKHRSANPQRPYAKITIVIAKL